MEFLQTIEIDLMSIALHLLLVFIVLIIGRFLAKASRKWLDKSLRKTNLTESLIVLTTTLT